MIGSINHLQMSRENRIAIAQRAVKSNPFWHLMEFEIDTAITQNVYGTKVEINEDFYVTDLRGNFGDLYALDAFPYSLTLFDTINDRTLYRFPQSPLLPSSLIVSEARFDVPIPNQVFDDRQIERFPFKIPKSNRLIGEVSTNGQQPAQDRIAEVCFTGFQVGINQGYFTESDTRRMVDSLETPIRYDYFKFTVDHQGFNKDYVIENDRFPRLILGFGAVNSTIDKSLVSVSKMRIEDFNRSIKFTNEAIPVQYIAPRLTCLNDEVLYYLPVEYYFEPFNNLRFNVSNDSPNPSFPQGYDFYMLTRTV